MGNPVVHWEVMGPDGGNLASFYNGLFDWGATEAPGMDQYHLVDAEKTGVGGAIGKGVEEMPSYVTIYIQVDDINDHPAKIEGAGGSSIVPRTEIPGTVTFALFADPAGNVVGLVEEETPAAQYAG